MSLFETTDQVVTFDALVGEGKKYKDNDAAAKALVEKDRFIEQLKWEKQEALKHTAPPAPDRSQEILDQLRVLATRETAPPVTEQPHQPLERTEVNSLTEDDVLRILQKRDQTSVATSNLNKVKAELQNKFGNATGQVLQSLQDEMGVEASFLDNLASQSPAAFLKLLEGKKADTAFTPPPSSVSTNPDFKPSGSKHQPRSYYVKLKHQNKAMYDSSAVQNQMYKDAMALGEAYLDVAD